MQARPCIFQPGNFTGCGSEGFKSLIQEFLHSHITYTHFIFCSIRSLIKEFLHSQITYTHFIFCSIRPLIQEFFHSHITSTHLMFCSIRLLIQEFLHSKADQLNETFLPLVDAGWISTVETEGAVRVISPLKPPTLHLNGIRENKARVHRSCSAPNVVYFILCKIRKDAFYVGSTKRIQGYLFASDI